ncbi:MAG: THUMP domain-containing protein [Bacteroidales bacterium]|nr:THUMP domain-containing protein [Bacteroidales bacterium]
MKIIGKTLYGLEKVLAEELASLGASNVKALNRAVAFTGDMRTLYRVNYCCRTALSFLAEISDFRIKTARDLYSEASKIRWDDFLSEKKTFSVVPVVNSPLFDHTHYPALVLKDAVADYFRKKNGIRPSVNTGDPDLVINLHISHDQVTVSLDSSGLPLFRRGYRAEQIAAPINEVLAAGILKIAGWNAASPLADLMCGSGTIPIEAAMIAAGIPAGRTRSSYGFQRWRDYDENLFSDIKLTEEKAATEPGISIYAGDISAEALRIARANASRAGVESYIRFEEADFAKSSTPEPGLTLVLNPPYGERLRDENSSAVYSMIGTTLKHRYPGCSAWIIAADRAAVNSLGLRPSSKHVLFNGSIECRLLNYKMFEGPARQRSG